VSWPSENRFFSTDRREAMPSKYSFTNYSAEWPIEFEREAERLRLLIGDELVAVHHIGSTSVPGLAAKPVIDLIPIARDIVTIDDCTPRLVDAGYKAWGEYGIVGRRFFTKDAGENRTHNLHVFADGNPEIERHLALCAYLRHNGSACREYAALKREVYARHPADIAAYNDGKDAWIKRTEPLAIEWFRRASSSQP
jgi:GrpB-like predicted nucleotidyltransferase (UPF0157 family)